MRALSIMEAKSTGSHEVAFKHMVRPCRSLLPCRKHRPSIQGAEVLADGFLGLAALSQNRRGLAPEGGPAHLLSPGIVLGAAGEDGPAGFRARLVTVPGKATTFILASESIASHPDTAQLPGWLLIHTSRLYEL